ncbi:hypothetical protein N9X77_02370 [Luminiphilus sp.]|nr:hypothetical protein [Luminiphilus sp.]
MAVNLSAKLDALGYKPLSCLQVQASDYDIKSTAVHITVINDFGESIKPAWLDRSGKLRLRKTSKSGTTWSERTLAGTVWVWLDETNKQCLGTTVIAPASVQPKVIRISGITGGQLSSLQASSDQKSIESLQKKSNSRSKKDEKKGARDRAVLSAFYSATSGPIWKKADKWLTDESVCKWHGVTCNKKSGRVEKLNLRFNNLTGSLPPIIGELDQLKTLDLDGNQLYGELPPELNNLKNLTQLDLGKNSFSGRVPKLDRLRKLVNFWVNDNEFAGVPPSILRYANVYSIDLSNNQFDGDLRFLPNSETRLRTLKASNNRLSGGLPSRIARMKNLSTFDVSNNLLSDLDRAVAERLASILTVRLGGNNFKCPLPFILGDVFAEDQEFCVGFTSQTSFSGSLQAEYSGSTGLGGQLAFKSDFVDGKREGLHQRWYPNGQFMLEESYINGKKQSLWRQWYDNGNLRLEKNYRDGKLHGPYLTFRDGSVSNTFCYRNGKNVHFSACSEDKLDTKSESTDSFADPRFMGTYYVNRVQMDGGRSSVLRLRKDGSVDFYKRGDFYKWRSERDEIIVSSKGATDFRVRFSGDDKVGETTFKDGNKWNDITLKKLSDSPDHQFDLFMLGTSRGSKDERCFNIGRGEFPHGTYPWSSSRGIPITSRTLEGCQSLCPKVLEELRDPKYSSEETRSYWADGTCPTTPRRVAKPSKASSVTRSESETTSDVIAPTMKTQVASAKPSVKKVDTVNQRMARIAHELNSNKRSFNALYTLEDVKIDYERQELNYFLKVHSSIDTLDVVSLTAIFKQSYCSAPKLELFRQNYVDAVWRFKDKTDRSLSIKASTADC